tara:strand:+ start:206 stop:358 length:153 start_codon:yes stop_codon:yes gene_type:complete
MALARECAKTKNAVGHATAMDCHDVSVGCLFSIGVQRGVGNVVKPSVVIR